MELLITLAPSLPVAVMLQGIRDEVRGGKSLSQALDARRDVFSRFYVNIVRAGEAGGALGTVLQRLSETMERSKELRDSVRSALIYPTILIFVAVASVMVLLVFVVPQFQSTFAQAGQGAATAHAGRHRRRHVPAQLVVGGAAGRGARGAVVSASRANPVGAPRA
jgi:general secretion pathway protein F